MNFKLKFTDQEENMDLSMNGDTIIKVPAYTSELENDSGFVTEDMLSAAVPTNTSQLANDSNFMTTTEVVNKINEAIADKTQFKFEVVDELPSVGEENVIYLAGWSSQEGNLYSEYLYVNRQWEMIGSIDMSLRNYYTSSYVDYLLETLEAAIRRDIPTSTSQLKNNSGFITNATVEKLKDSFFSVEETTIEWDGNTEGREYIELSLGSNKVPCYKVSDIIIRTDAFGWGNMTVTYENGATTSTSPSLTPTETSGKWFDINHGVGCVFDSELSGFPTGIYFFSANFSGNGMPIGLSPIMVEKLKEECLPDHEHEGFGGGAVESVNGKTGAVVLNAEDVGALPNTTKIPLKVSELENDEKYLKSYTETDPTVPAWAKNPTKPTYTASEVGADPSGTAELKVSAHNTDTDAHNDLRLLIEGLTTRLDTLANSDDKTLDQMAEVVAYIKSNRTLIESVTTGKVSVTDIVNNLTTNVSNKPLSAAQGVALKGLIDALQTSVGNIKVPTKTSQLINDSGFVTENPDLSIYATKEELSDHNEQSDAHFDIRQLISKLDSEKIDKTSIVDDLETNVVNYPLSAAQGAKLKRLIDDITVPTKTSQLTNDSKFMSTEEVVAKINEAISSVAGGLKFEIVDTIEDLPTWCDDSNTIYLVPSEKTEGNQYYDEYLWMNGRWEKLGDTRVNLAPYYTELEVDNLIYNVQKSIPTKMSQLYNDVDYVKASELETGEATWNSIKGNIIERVGTPVTWDGNTEGREVYEMKGSITGTFYKVSDIVVKAEDIVGCSYYTQVGGAIEKIVPERGTGALFGLADNEHMWMLIAAGMVCLYDDSQGCSPGLYFNVGPYEYDNTKTEFVTKLIVEHDKIKPELLPDIMETVGSDTLTWDGNTEGVNANGLFYLATETVPTVEDLRKGGSFTNSLGTVVQFTSDNVIDAEAASAGTSCFVLSSATAPFAVVVVEPNATLTLVNNGQTFNFNFEKAGVYFSDGRSMGYGYYINSLTINGYTGFTKEVIKEEYLPPMESGVKTKVFTDTMELFEWLKVNANKFVHANVIIGDRHIQLTGCERTYDAGEVVYVSMSACLIRDIYTDHCRAVNVILGLDSTNVKYQQCAVKNYNGTQPQYTKEDDTVLPHSYAAAMGATATVLYVD